MGVGEGFEPPPPPQVSLWWVAEVDKWFMKQNMRES